MKLRKIRKRLTFKTYLVRSYMLAGPPYSLAWVKYARLERRFNADHAKELVMHTPETMKTKVEIKPVVRTEVWRNLRHL